ncbi:hypothetical protein [Streptomyces sp. NPDC059788]|uniref:hypothetical protein n=1 Tax=Streptomyces sp. NPDC059788 TaxID=3346948 RepID=UPI003667F55C
MQRGADADQRDQHGAQGLLVIAELVRLRALLFENRGGEYFNPSSPEGEWRDNLWFREQEVARVDLSASSAGEPLYRTLGFADHPDPALYWRP